MTMFERIREAGFRAVSRVFNKGDDDGVELAEIEAEIELCICAGLDPYLSGVVRDLNEQHSAANVVPLRRAS